MTLKRNDHSFSENFNTSRFLRKSRNGSKVLVSDMGPRFEFNILFIDLISIFDFLV